MTERLFSLVSYSFSAVMKLLVDNFTVDRIWAQDNSAHTIVCPIKWPPRSPGNSKLDLFIMAFPVVAFLRQGYKIKKVFG